MSVIDLNALEAAAMSPDTSEAELQEIFRQIQEIEHSLQPPDEDDEPLAGESPAERMRRLTEESQEITIPPIANLMRRESCRHNLRKFCLTYFQSACCKGFAPYQEEMVAAFQSVILNGGKKARAVRRGGLKSTLARIATAWAILYGHRRFPVLVGATDDKSNEHRDNLLDMLKSSAELKADFPELLPLLLKRANPKKMLRLNGEMLVCTAKDDRGVIVLPRIASPDGRPCDLSESRVAPYSMTATDVSGLSFVNSSGEVVRPDLLIFDDVQTPQSAQSFMLTSKRENSIATTFMGLAGLAETIAAIMVCTVREENDLTMRFCDRKLHPDWDGQTFPIMLTEPDSNEAKEHWTIYGQHLREGDTPEAGFAIATGYYITHRDVMDAGGKAAWESDYEKGYVSAIQWCMTKKILEPHYYRTELQQKGALPPGDVMRLDPRQLVKRFSGVPRGTVPARASYVTAFVDSSDHVLWWAVCGWMKDLTGWIIDFGTWPNQHRDQFYKSDLHRTLENELPGAPWEEAFVNAHNKLDDFLLGREWPVEGGGSRAIDLMLKDWSDGSHKPRIESQLTASPYRTRIRPSKGFGPKPGRKAVHLYGDPHRDRHTFSGWVERRSEYPVHVQFDTNIFKSNIARRLQTVIGAPSALLLPGDNEQDLMLLAEHLTSEIAKPLVYDGTAGVVYEALVGRDNDWWDTTVGCAVAASMLGCALPGEESLGRKPKTGKPRSLAEVMAG